MKTIALRAAKWLLEKYAPEHHVHANPKIRKEKPDLQSREAYMRWREKRDANRFEIVSPGELNADFDKVLRKCSAPDPKDFEGPAEFQHEMEKFVMKAEAQMEGDR